MLLIKDKNTFEEYFPVGKNLSFSKITPFLRDAERELAQVIGADFLTEISENTDETNKLFELKEILSGHVCYYAYYKGFDFINTNFSNQGFHRIELETDGKKSLYQRQELELKHTFKTRGLRYFDEALLLMEQHKDNFPTWASSPNYTLQRDHFINSTAILEKHYPINESRSFFLKMRPFQTVAEDMDLKPILGNTLFSQLKHKIYTDTISTDESLLIREIQKAATFCSLLRGGYSLAVLMHEYGIYKLEMTSGGNNIISAQLPSKEMLDAFFADLKEKADFYKKNLKDFLEDNAELYPDYNKETPTARSSGSEKIIII